MVIIIREYILPPAVGSNDDSDEDEEKSEANRNHDGVHAPVRRNVKSRTSYDDDVISGSVVNVVTDTRVGYDA